MLLLALVLPLGVEGVNLPGVLFSLAAIALFLARFPLELWVRGRGSSRPLKWSLGYLLAAFLLVLPLLLGYGRWLLVPLAALYALLVAGHLYLVRRRRERTIWAELLVIAGLCLAAAGVHYALVGELQGQGPLLSGLTFLYLGASVFYVRMMVRRPARGGLPGSRRLAQGRGLFAYLAVLGVVLAAMWEAGWISPLASIAYLPLALKALGSIGLVRGKANIKTLGFMEVGHSALFALLLLWSFPG